MISTQFTGWHNAQASDSNNGGCVEVGYAPEHVGIRDTTLGGHSPVVVFTAATFGALQEAIRDGRFGG